MAILLADSCQHTRDIEGTPDQSCHPPDQLGGLVTLEDALVGGDEVRLPDDDVVEEEHVLGDEGEDGDEGDEEHDEHVHDLPPLAGRADSTHPVQPLRGSSLLLHQYSRSASLSTQLFFLLQFFNKILNKSAQFLFLEKSVQLNPNILFVTCILIIKDPDILSIVPDKPWQTMFMWVYISSNEHPPRFWTAPPCAPWFPHSHFLTLAHL